MAAKRHEFQGKTWKTKRFVESKIDNAVNQLSTNPDADDILFYLVCEGERYYPMAQLRNERSHYLMHYLIAQGFMVTN